MGKNKMTNENSSGLVDGMIPKGTGCPYIKLCVYKIDKCPTNDFPRERDFSCGAARLFKIATKSK
jgi:hypothetical protein